MRKNKDYKPSRETIRHVDEVLKLMKDERFIKAQNESEGDVTNMCEALDKVENRGIERGKEIGKILAYSDMKLSTTEIAEKVGMTEEEIIGILQENE